MTTVTATVHGPSLSSILETDGIAEYVFGAVFKELICSTLSNFSQVCRWSVQIRLAYPENAIAVVDCMHVNSDATI